MNCCLDTVERFDPVHLEHAVKSCRQDKVEKGASRGSLGQWQKRKRYIPLHRRAHVNTQGVEREITNYAR